MKLDLERAAILEHNGGLHPFDAEQLAYVPAAEPPSMLEAALAYVARGWAVMPLHWPTVVGPGARCSCRKDTCGRSTGKHPRTANGVHDASKDPEQVRAWWERWPLANVGIATGSISGIVVLDVDVADDKRGDETLLDLVTRHGSIGDTLHAITGSAGDHYVFVHPGVAIGNSTGKLGRGIDTRGDGGLIVAPPSLHFSGERYAWCRGGDLASMPAWMLALLATSPDACPAPASGRRPSYHTRSDHDDRCFRASQYLARMPHAIAGEGGHDATMRAAVALVRGFDLSTNDALDLLLHEYNPRCDPPWGKRDLEHKVQSAMGANRVGRGYLLGGEK